MRDEGGREKRPPSESRGMPSFKDSDHERNTEHVIVPASRIPHPASSASRLHPRRTAGRDHDHRHPGGADYGGGGRGAEDGARGRRSRRRSTRSPTAFDEYKNKATAYPPNCQTDDQVMTGGESPGTPLDEAGIVNDVRRHIKQLAPRSQESDSLALLLTGQKSSDTQLPATACLADYRPRKPWFFGWVVLAPIRNIRFRAKGGRRIRSQH